MRRLKRKLVPLTILFASFALSGICCAQDGERLPNIDSAIEVARHNMEADKTTIISAAMQFNDQEAAAFWPIYRQYERERSTLGDARVSVIKEYSEKYPNVSDAEAKDMAERMFEYDARLAALKKGYYRKFNKVLPALMVTKFFQLDRRIDLLVDMQVESSLPPLTNAKLDQAKERDEPSQEQ
jgi:hypothetical protein